MNDVVKEKQNTVFDEIELMDNLSEELFKVIQSKHAAGYTLFWHNPRGFTPQQIAKAYGTRAAFIFKLSQTIQQVCKLAHPDYVFLLPTEPFTVNPDGTVTVGEKIG